MYHNNSHNTIILHWRLAEHAISKYATSIYGLFWAKALEKQQMQVEHSNLLFPSWKGDRNTHIDDAFPILEKK